METFSRHCRFILTCNYVERIIDPIQSRCQSFQIIPPDRKQIAQHLSNILDNENVKYELDNIVTIVNGGYPDIRRVINSSQRQVVNGELKIDESTIIQNDYKLQVLEVLKTQDKKNSFKNIRQVLADSKITDFSDLFRLLFDTVDDWGRGHVAECILVLSRYQQSDAVVVDKEINIMAMFVEVIGIIK
jgi:replication factor C small subunit